MVSGERLRQIPLFAELSDADRARLAEWFTEDEVAAGHHFVYEGSAGYMFFVLEEGTVAVTQGGDVVARLGPGDVFGEMAFFGDGHRRADVVAETRVRVLIMFGTRFRELQMELPDVAAELERLVLQRARELDRG
jgi:CRP-like cAMP-binding protein